MEIGIFGKVFPRPTFGEVLAAVRAHGLSAIQLNLVSAGLPSLPEELPAETVAQLAGELKAHGVRVASLSGTFNMAHPDPARRAEGLRRLEVLLGACAALETDVLTICTGTRHPDNMWAWHADNDSPEAWADARATIRAAAEMAAGYGVAIGLEPEVANVVHSARKARRMLDEVGLPNLKIVMDGANLFHTGELPRMTAILEEAFELLGGDIVLAHAKDLARDGEAGQMAAGTGRLDFDLYVRRLQQCGYRGAIVLHGLAEGEVDAAVQFLQGKLA
ncbi:MAG: sugar phosphate isomerase/epimerase [Chloroflexi bacterium]|nr:sugar phosphate isomerase/epimerase [Anaerolineaceae bacterium]NMB88571.1 sugar phosphate isomerase/epimerase [Chloroflexota bacterium]